jgi:hypothetical protein
MYLPSRIRAEWDGNHWKVYATISYPKYLDHLNYRYVRVWPYPPTTTAPATPRTKKPSEPLVTALMMACLGAWVLTVAIPVITQLTLLALLLAPLAVVLTVVGWVVGKAVDHHDNRQASSDAHVHKSEDETSPE